MAHTPDVNLLLDQTGWIRGLARRLVADTHAAEDLIQEIWVEALEHRPDPRRPMRGWLATVMRNRLVSHRRRDVHRSERERDASREEREPSTFSVVERASTHQDLVQNVMGLDEPYRSTILMRFFEDLSYGEIARRMGVTKATVNSRITRGLERLRQKLETQYGNRRAFLMALLPLAKTGGVGLGIGANIMSASIGLAAATLVGMTVSLGLSGGTESRSPFENDTQTLAALGLPTLSAPAQERREVKRVQESDRKEAKQKDKNKLKRKGKGETWKTELAHSMPLPASVKKLNINTGAGNLEFVESYSGSVDIDVKVSAQLKHVEAHEMTHIFEDHVTIEEDADGILTIKDAHENERGWAISLKIAIPAALPLSANTGAGNVMVRHATGKMNLNSGAGNVEVQMPDQEVSGINANSGAGSVIMNIARVEKSIKLNSGAGNVRLELRDWDSPGTASLNSGAGSVYLYVPANVIGEFDLETGMGDINVPSELGLDVDDDDFGAKASGTVGQGGGTFKMNSGIGSVTIKFGKSKKSQPL